MGAQKAVRIIPILFLIPALAFAGGDRNKTDVDVDVFSVTTLKGGNTTGGDTTVSTGGNKAFAFSHSLGDVDINEGQNCFGSEAWGTVIVSRQTLELNPWCAALFYELNGKHERAAALRCTIKEIVKTHPYLGDEKACIAGETLRPDEPLVTGEVPEEIPVQEYIEQKIAEAVDEEVMEQQEQVEFRIAQQQNLIASVQQQNEQLRVQIAEVGDVNKDLRAYIQAQEKRKEAARAILNRDNDEEHE